MNYKTDCDRVRLVRERSTTLERNKLNGSHLAKDYFRRIYEQNNDEINLTESFCVLTCSNDLTVLGWSKLSEGGLTSTVVDVRVLCRFAIETLCTRAFVCHNHPSGNLEPSATDKALTKKIKEALKMFDVELIDHIILTEDGHFSFSDEGLL